MMNSDDKQFLQEIDDLCDKTQQLLDSTATYDRAYEIELKRIYPPKYKFTAPNAVEELWHEEEK